MDDLPDLLALTGGVAAGPTAALLHGLDLVEPPALHHVLVPRRSHRRAPAGCRLHRADLRSGESLTQGGLAVTAVARTVLDCARWLPLEPAVVVGDSALRRRSTSRTTLDRAVAGLPPSRTRLRIARVLDLLDPRCESVLESLARVALTRAGLAPPEVQLVVADERGQLIGRVDFAWPAAGLVVEVDGYAYHSTPQQLARDRARVNALTRLGLCVLRFGWGDVVGTPAAFTGTVRAVLAELS